GQTINLNASSPGTYYLHVLSVDNAGNALETVSGAVTVRQLATGITVSPTPTTVEKGKTKQLTATVTPSNASNKGVTWTSSNTGVATVNSSGVVTGVKAGNVTITAKTADGSNKSATCSITVQDPTPVTIGSDDASWATMNRIATAIAKDSSINSSSTKATGYTANGERYEISVGGIYKVKYNGEERQVRVLGFKHDDLVNTGIYGGSHTKASISFEFLDFMTGSTQKNMNSSHTNSGGWGSTAMRTFLNGTDGKEKLSNKAYIKQVKKRYIATYNSASSVTTCNDYLWLLAASEIVNSGYQSGYYAYAITTEGGQYKYYQGISASWNSLSSERTKKTGGSAYGWWLRSPYYSSGNDFCNVNASGSVGHHNSAGYSSAVAPGFCI
ncbi:MAG: Ig domain-containing protein, partial [Clostridia bacterium]|nr:Ig domain-containing protein [Clostridia bacterium]